MAIGKTKIQTTKKFALLILVIGCQNLIKLCKLPHWSSNKDGKGKSSRGPDKIEYNNGVTATACPS